MTHAQQKQVNRQGLALFDQLQAVGYRLPAARGHSQQIREILVSHQIVGVDQQCPLKLLDGRSGGMHLGQHTAGTQVEVRLAVAVGITQSIEIQNDLGAAALLASGIGGQKGCLVTLGNRPRDVCRQFFCGLEVAANKGLVGSFQKGLS